MTVEPQIVKKVQYLTMVEETKSNIGNLKGTGFIGAREADGNVQKG